MYTLVTWQYLGGLLYQAVSTEISHEEPEVRTKFLTNNTNKPGFNCINKVWYSIIIGRKYIWAFLLTNIISDKLINKSGEI